MRAIVQSVIIISFSLFLMGCSATDHGGSVRGTLTFSDGCDLTFSGRDRKAVKLRPPDLDYAFLNGGRPVGLPDFFAAVCPLDERVPTRRGEVSQEEPLPEERLRVKVRGYVMAIKLEGDNDLHVQIANSPAPFDQEQIVVEIPPGGEYCDARTTMMNLFRADGGTRVSRHIFNRPPQVDVTGYLFLDAAHMRARRTDFCTDNGGRGIRAGRGASPVRGIWELHPVIRLEAVGGVPVGPTSTPTVARPSVAGISSPEGNPDVRVWVNTNSGVYHCPGTRWYGRTKEGVYMTQREAREKGNRPAYGSVCQ
jgi:hypothetical protein